jgi:hypothetical protein
MDATRKSKLDNVDDHRQSISTQSIKHCKTQSNITKTILPHTTTQTLS